jgi:hypothetical protein
MVFRIMIVLLVVVVSDLQKVIAPTVPALGLV